MKTHATAQTETVARERGLPWRAFAIAGAMAVLLGVAGDGFGGVWGLPAYFGFVVLGWRLAARLEPGSGGAGACVAALGGVVAWECMHSPAAGWQACLVGAIAVFVLTGRWLAAGVLGVTVPWLCPGGVLLAVLLGAAGLTEFLTAGGRGRLSALAAGFAGLFAGICHELARSGFESPAVASSVSVVGRQSLRQLGNWITGTGGDVQMVMLPVLGIVLAVAVIVSRGRSGLPCTGGALWAAAALAVSLVLSARGSDGPGPLLWALGLLPVLAVAGVYRLGAVWPGLAVKAGVGVLVVFQCVAALSWAAHSYEEAGVRAAQAEFLADAEAAVQKHLKYGVTDIAAIGGIPSHRQVSSIRDIHETLVCAAEILKADRSRRFGVLVARSGEEENGVLKSFLLRRLAGQVPTHGEADALSLWRTNWTRLEASMSPTDGEIVGLLEGARVAVRIDVGNPESEAAADWIASARPADASAPPVLLTSDDPASPPISDGGRLVTGGQSFRVTLDAAGNAVLILRTAFEVPVWQTRRRLPSRDVFEFDSPLVLGVRLNGLDAGKLRFDENDAVFSEAMLSLKREMYPDGIAEIEIEGPCSSFHIWLYQ